MTRRFRPLYRAASLAAVCLSAACATLPTPQEQELLERKAPLFTRLLGETPTVLPASLAGQLAYARADEALAAGRPSVSAALLAEAVAALPADAPPCSSRAALLYLQGLAAQLAGEDREEAGWTALREGCLDLQVGETERPAQLFFSFLAVREQDGPRQEVQGITGSDFKSPALAARARWLAGLEAALQHLAGPRREQLAAWLAWMRWQDLKSAGVCDLDFDSRKRQSARELYARLERVGRPDLAAGYRATMLVSPDGALLPDGLTELSDWAQVPGNRWLRMSEVSQALSAVRWSADWANPLTTAPLCDLLFSDLREELTATARQGSNWRNATRLMEGFRVSAVCLKQAELSELTNLALAAATAAGSEGRTGVLEVLGGITLQLALDLVQGRGELLGMVLPDLMAAVEQVRKGLGSSREEAVLAQLLAVYGALPSLLEGTPLHLLKVLEQSVATCDRLLQTPPEPTDPGLVRALPGIRAAARLAVALGHWIGEEPEAATAQLEQLRTTLPADLNALLQFLELPDHSDALVRLVDGYTGLARLVEEGEVVDWPAEMARMATATAPGPNELGWWAVGLGSARFLAWDLLGLIARDQGAASSATEALGKGEQLCAEAVEELARISELPETLLTFLRLLPPVHRAIPVLLEEGLEGHELALKVAAELEQPLADLLGRMAAAPEAAPGEGRVAELINELLATFSKAGLQELIKDPKAALGTVLEQFEGRLDRHPGQVRVFLTLIAAVARYYHDPASASERFAEAAQLSVAALPEVAFVPHLLEASLRSADGAKPEQILSLLDQALATGQPALACGRFDSVHALLPARMWLNQQRGRYADAAADYHRFASLLDLGFPGDAFVRCQLSSRADTFIFTADINNSVAAFMLPGKSEGSFQIGMGTQTGAEGRGSQDELVCSSAVGQSLRYDRIMEAHLAFAAYALLQNDFEAAHRALLAALAAGRIILNGSAALLGTRMAALLDSSRTKLDLALVGWVALLARLKGQTMVADSLEEIAVAVGTYQEVGWYQAMADGEEPPVLLQGINALSDFAPLASAFARVRSPAESAALATALAAWHKRTGQAPPWAVELVRDRTSGWIEHGQRPARPEEIKAPSDGFAKTVVASRNLLWQATLRQQPPAPEPLAAAVASLTRLGLLGEAVGLLYRSALLAWGANDRERTFQLLDLAMAALPEEGYPTLRIDTLLLARNLLAAEGQFDSCSSMLAYGGQDRFGHCVSIPARIAQLRGGLQPLQDELSNLVTLLNHVGALMEINSLRDLTGILLPAVSRTYGNGHYLYLTLLGIEIAAGEVAGQSLPAATLEGFKAHLARVGGQESLSAFLDLLVAAPDPESRKAKALAFLSFLFQGGPQPE